MSRPTVTSTVTGGPSSHPSPLIEDQIRDYRQTQRARFNTQRQVRRITRFITGRGLRDNTLEQIVNPETQLQLSMQERAATVPAEVLYRSRPQTDPHHRVYIHRSEEQMSIIGTDQQNRLFIQPDSVHILQRSGIQFIHLGILQVRLQILHRTFEGTMALVIFRDTRWTDDHSIIAAMEVDLSTGNQLIYVIPDIIMTIGDFARHIQISILTRGYDNWSGGEANLLVTRGMTARLSNTPNTGFAYQINHVAEFLVSRGVRAIPGQQYDTRRFQNTLWNIRPSSIQIPEQPTSMVSHNLLDNSISLQFGGYQATRSARPSSYSAHDEEIEADSDSDHILAILEEDDTSDNTNTEFFSYLQYFSDSFSGGSRNREAAAKSEKFEQTDEDIWNEFL
nr:P3a, polyprotein [Andraeanum bacilliform virus]